MQKKISVLDVMIDAVTMSEAVSILEQYMSEPKAHLIATANAEMVMMAQQDKELAEVLRAADLIVPDGAGVVWAARYNGLHMPERVAGYDLVQQFLAAGAKKDYRFFLLGGAPGVAEKAKAAAEFRYPGVQIVGTQNGFFTKDNEKELLDRVNASGANVLLAALGIPRQEKWLYKNMRELNISLAIGVGGTFDVMAGTVKRAPLWMQQANLEWLFRLVRQPQRALRMLALPHFVIKVMAQKTLDKSKLGIL
ncbi:N-acetylglucosaminyldiphosphoundecaprenol N-acetyl-beta-D-mannosaminyltransferase [bioreactor metagenome]|uniref:N-acetylglucosaminyldiphosphoundecaprenol N-acetyl-beta-D-mannosaminyltransferase n=1 Tax=bioreactor metagenome TaxID=1076179 RepID=A0A644T122_9ZZZZ|nr:WecB/TagA/CpsF family glycosyltransferase [Negativicutes bacterium]